MGTTGATRRRAWAARMNEAGFTIEEAHYMNLPGMIAWFIDAKVLRRKFVPPSHDGLFQRMVPRIAAVERKIRPPVGLSLVVVGRKACVGLWIQTERSRV